MSLRLRITSGHFGPLHRDQAANSPSELADLLGHCESQPARVQAVLYIAETHRFHLCLCLQAEGADIYGCNFEVSEPKASRLFSATHAARAVLCLPRLETGRGDWGELKAPFQTRPALHPRSHRSPVLRTVLPHRQRARAQY